MGKTEPTNKSKARVAAQLELLQARKQVVPDISSSSLLKKVKKAPMKKGVKAKKEKIYQRALINSEKEEERIIKTKRKTDIKRVLKNIWE
ncbi:hypothetical protein BC937DRAFT_88270 [Endogone sp. FLAS-F59071]|nr:hypothetical protein BC937DRAFT_88270 [Endogone sp. FLAS-F59071]|eukprot:RUS18845.1 hypothetical protein BC937DRAFT_88270 [Endogone sp. FLAS-F59071]